MDRGSGDGYVYLNQPVAQKKMLSKKLMMIVSGVILAVGLVIGLYFGLIRKDYQSTYMQVLEFQEAWEDFRVEWNSTVRKSINLDDSVVLTVTNNDMDRLANMLNSAVNAYVIIEKTTGLRDKRVRDEYIKLGEILEEFAGGNREKLELLRSVRKVVLEVGDTIDFVNRQNTTDVEYMRSYIDSLFEPIIDETFGDMASINGHLRDEVKVAIEVMRPAIMDGCLKDRTNCSIGILENVGSKWEDAVYSIRGLINEINRFYPVIIVPNSVNTALDEFINSFIYKIGNDHKYEDV